jgi:osmotically-inducible protein OsmY
MWQQKSDDDLARDVGDALHWDPSVESADITVSARNGIVTLSGAVPSYVMRTAAGHLAERVGGTRGVVQHLEVRVPHFHSRADADLAAAAANALRWDIEVPDEEVRPSVDNGHITLDGQVAWRYQLEAAERAVRHLAGVTGVTNNLRVAPTATVGDVRQHIADALRRHAEIDARNITVETRDGTVTLRGTVHSLSERADARMAAWSAPGVRSVDDHLTISA